MTKRRPTPGRDGRPGAAAKPPRYQKIVVATDGSEGAARAVQSAVEIAKASGGRVLAVCVARVSEFATLESDGIDPHAEERCEVALSAAKRIAKDAGVDIALEMARGHPADRLLAIVEREKPDLVVVGTRGLSASRRLLMGSVSDAVSKHAKCAVLVVR